MNVTDSFLRHESKIYDRLVEPMVERTIPYSMDHGFLTKIEYIENAEIREITTSGSEDEEELGDENVVDVSALIVRCTKHYITLHQNVRYGERRTKPYHLLDIWTRMVSNH